MARRSTGQGIASVCRRLWHTRATVVAAPYACGAAAPGRSCDTTRSRDSRGRRSRRIHASYGIARAQAGSPPEPQRRVYSRVKVCGHEYTSLAWFLGRGNPFPRDCHRAAATCGRNALELQNGDAKTLLARGFARGRPAQGKELLLGRRSMPGAWVDTACLAVQGGGAVQPQWPGSVRGSRGVLWRVSDLQAAFGD